MHDCKRRGQRPRTSMAHQPAIPIATAANPTKYGSSNCGISNNSRKTRVIRRPPPHRSHAVEDGGVVIGVDIRASDNFPMHVCRQVCWLRFGESVAQTQLGLTKLRFVPPPGRARQAFGGPAVLLTSNRESPGRNLEETAQVVVESVLRADSARKSADRTVVLGRWSPLVASRHGGGSTHPRIGPGSARVRRALAPNGNRAEEPVRLETSRMMYGSPPQHGNNTTPISLDLCGDALYRRFLHVPRSNSESGPCEHQNHGPADTVSCSRHNGDVTFGESKAAELIHCQSPTSPRTSSSTQTLHAR